MTLPSNGKDHTLRFVSVSISLKGRELLSIDETILPGEILTVMGPSGSGKSSLLGFAAGFLEPAFVSRGAVYLDDENLTDLPAYERHLGLMFQDALLFPHMSVGQNLAFALPVKPSQTKADRAALIDQALRDAGLPDMADRDPATLSGGQRSRVALMRTLLAEPRALLLDEPFSKLDAELRDQIRQFVFAEAKKRMLPVLLVTHDREDCEAAGGRTVVLGGQQ